MNLTSGTFMDLEAGFALNTQGSVKALMPIFAGNAGFLFSFMLSMPPNLKLTCYPS